MRPRTEARQEVVEKKTLSGASIWLVVESSAQVESVSLQTKYIILITGYTSGKKSDQALLGKITIEKKSKVHSKERPFLLLGSRQDEEGLMDIPRE